MWVCSYLVGQYDIVIDNLTGEHILLSGTSRPEHIIVTWSASLSQQIIQTTSLNCEIKPCSCKFLSKQTQRVRCRTFRHPASFLPFVHTNEYTVFKLCFPNIEWMSESQPMTTKLIQNAPSLEVEEISASLPRQWEDVKSPLKSLLVTTGPFKTYYNWVCYLLSFRPEPTLSSCRDGCLANREYCVFSA